MQPVTGTVSQCEDARSGKSIRLNINGQWYSTKNFDMRDLVGQVITFTPSASEYNGKTYFWINDYSAGTQGTTTTTPSGQPVPQGQGAKDPLVYLPMTSNLVAHAIQAGRIDSPDQLREWASAAFNAARNLIEADFDDDIPF